MVLSTYNSGTFLLFQGSCFIRTDQLDGETDWKLKVAVSCTQRLPALGVSTVITPSFIVIFFSIVRSVLFIPINLINGLIIFENNFFITKFIENYAHVISLVS